MAKIGSEWGKEEAFEIFYVYLIFRPKTISQKS